MNTDVLVMFYKAASRRIISTINTSTDFSRQRKLQILGQVDEVLGELDKKTQKWLTKEMRDAYLQGKVDTQSLLSKVGISIETTFNKIDEEAVKAMTEDAFLHFGEAMSGVKRYTSQLLNEATKQRLRAIMAEGRISGATKREIANNIAGELRKGFIALKDKSGKEWSLENYAEMLARTKATEATNQGMVNSLTNDGFDLVQVTNHGTKCQLCGPHEGEIYSISGKSKDYPSLGSATGLFHPRCEHRLVPYHEDFARQSKQWSADLLKYI
jgi:hypothetical protein